jgi:hypothetical protein
MSKWKDYSAKYIARWRWKGTPICDGWKEKCSKWCTNLWKDAQMIKKLQHLYIQGSPKKIETIKNEHFTKKKIIINNKIKKMKFPRSLHFLKPHFQSFIQFGHHWSICSEQFLKSLSSLFPSYRQAWIMYYMHRVFALLVCTYVMMCPNAARNVTKRLPWGIRVTFPNLFISAFKSMLAKSMSGWKNRMHA